MSRGADVSAPVELRLRAYCEKPSGGFLYILSVPICAGLAAGEGVSIAGMNYTGPLWFGALLLGVLVLLADLAAHREVTLGFPGLRWTGWCAIVLGSMIWTDAPFGRSLQDGLQLCMPVFIGMLAARFVRTTDQLAALLGSFAVTLAMLVGWVLLRQAGLLDALGIDCAVRSLSLTAVLIGCVALSSHRTSATLALVGWGICLGLSIVTGSRMATIALLAAPVIYPEFRSRAWNILLLVCLLAVAWGLFHTSYFQQRFFYTGSGTLWDVLEGEFLSFGRFESWPEIWDEAWRRQWLGRGVGSSYDFVPQVWDEMHHVHNDYLRIFFEFGLIGLAVFLLVTTWQILEVAALRRSAAGVERRVWTACQLGLVLFLLTCLTDNTLIYNLWFTDPLFALMGAAYGVRQARMSAGIHSVPAEWPSDSPGFEEAGR